MIYNGQLTGTVDRINISINEQRPTKRWFSEKFEEVFENLIAGYEVAEQD